MVVGDQSDHRPRRKWQKTKDILDLQSYLAIEFAVLDLLILYSPINNEDMKCKGLGKNWLSYSEFQSSC